MNTYPSDCLRGDDAEAEEALPLTMPDAIAAKLDEQKTAEVAGWCAEVGFPLSDVRLERDVLVLVPERLGALPDVRLLQGLAQRIQLAGYRHVAFAVEPDTAAPDA